MPRAARQTSVTIHYAQTLDGRIATHSGHSQWISCKPSLRLAHQLRARHDAVMVGVNTVLADDPRLTVRLVRGRSPVRIVVDSTLRLPLDAHLLTDGSAPTVIATTGRAPADRARAIGRMNAEVLIVDENASGRVDLRSLLARLPAFGISSLLVEGGAALITSTLRDRLAGRLIVCIAPKLVGGGIEAVGDLNILTMQDAISFTRSSFSGLGEDIIFDGEFAPEPVPVG